MFLILVLGCIDERENRRINCNTIRSNLTLEEINIYWKENVGCISYNKTTKEEIVIFNNGSAK